MPGTFSPIDETQIGAVAYLNGITNNGSAFSISPITSAELSDISVKYTWDEKENKDTTGNVQSFTQTNFRYEMSLKFNPSGATRLAAAAVADSIFTMQTLTFSNFKSATVGGGSVSINQTWRIKPGATLDLKMAENASCSIECERYVNAGQNAALTGAAIVG